MVYDDAEKLYAEIKKDGEALLEAALKVLYPRSSPVDLRLPLPTALATSGALIGHNTTPFQRRDIIPLPLGGAGAALKNKVVQTSSDGTIGYALMESEQSDEGRVRSACRGMFADCKPTSGIYFYSFFLTQQKLILF
jgi:alpha-mannosidase